MTPRLALALTALVLAGATAIVLGFYSHTGQVATAEASKLGLRYSRNSIRHAYAAVRAYNLARVIGLPPARAEKLVLKLGYLNEYAEHYFKRRQDPTREIYKDLFNNLGGLKAARWAEQCPSVTGRDLVFRLASMKTLRYTYEDARIPSLPAGADLTSAIGRFRQDKDEIARTVEQSLITLTPECGHPAQQL